MMNKKNWLPLFCACLGHILWGFSYLFTKTALNIAAPNILLSFRFLCSTTIMTLLMVFGKAKFSFRGKNWTPAILLIVLQILYYSFESYSVLYTNATFSGVVLAVAPIVAIVFAIFFLREYPTRRQTIFCILPVVGVIWMTVAGNSLGIIQPKGLLFLILTCLTSAAFKTANRKAAQEFTSFERTYLVLAASAVCFTIFALRDVNFDMQTYFAPLAELPFVGSVLTLSILSSVGANLLVNYAVSKMSVVTFSSFGALTTLCSMFAGVVFLHEPMSASLLFGAVLILVGIYQVTRPDKAKIQK